MTDNPLPPFTIGHQVRTFETGFTGKMTPSALINLMQHAAGKHADALGWSVRSMHLDGQTWVLQRFCMHIENLPLDDANILIKTRPSGADRLLAYRDYEVATDDGTVLARATSSWVVMDLESRRPLPISDDVRDLGSRFGPPLPIPEPLRLRPFEAAPDAPVFRVRLHDLDLNRHVNNVRYIEWALEAVPAETFEKAALSSLDITFKLECFHGDEIASGIMPTGPATFDHCLTRLSNKKPVCLMRSVWKGN